MENLPKLMIYLGQVCGATALNASSSQKILRFNMNLVKCNMSCWISVALVRNSGGFLNPFGSSNRPFCGTFFLKNAQKMLKIQKLLGNDRFHLDSNFNRRDSN